MDEQYFQGIEKEEASFAARLARYLIATYAPKSVVDFGCATGLYLEPFAEAGVHVLGIDNAPVLAKMSRIKNLVLHDLRVPYDTGAKLDLALCLEVLEHIDEEWADVMVDNIAAASDLLIISAARPGQGGEGHVNLQPKKYWQGKFASRGFAMARSDTKKLITAMKDGYHMGWFVQNAMVLKRQVDADTHTRVGTHEDKPGVHAVRVHTESSQDDRDDGKPRSRGLSLWGRRKRGSLHAR